MTELTDIQAAIEAGRELGAGQLKSIGGVPVLVAPAGYQPHELHHLAERPHRTEADVLVNTAGSFIAYVKKYRRPDTAVFCDLERGRITAVIDYHSPDQPDWRQHTVRLDCTKTQEFKDWEERNHRGMNQTEFAEFIEDHLEDIVDPPGAQMLEICTTMRFKTKIAFNKAIRLQDGQTQLIYSEDTESGAGAKGELRIPDAIKLGIQVIEDGPHYELEAKFRYRIHDGILKLWYKLMRPDKAFRAAVLDVHKTIDEQLGDQTLIIMGTP